MEVKNKSTLGGIAVVIAVLAVVAVLVLAGNKGSKDNEQNKNLNIPAEAKSESGNSLKVVDSSILTNGKLTVALYEDEKLGSYYVSAFLGEKMLIEPSLLGIKINNTDFSDKLVLDNKSMVKSNGVDEYTLTTGNKREAKDAYEALTVKFTKDDEAFNLELRLYKDAYAFRYIYEGEDGKDTVIKGEYSEYLLPDEAKIWSGFDQAGNYEYTYGRLDINGVKKASATYSAPLLANYEDSFLLLTEAAVFSDEATPYCASSLVTVKDSKAIKYAFGTGEDGQVILKNENGGVHTPWRVAVIAENVNDLVNTTVVTSLNPSYDEDLFKDYKEWVRPGKVAWSWWSEAGDDPVEYDQQKQYIDFAAENGWEYVCVDFGWCLWKDYDAKVRELVEYGKNKNVDIMLWYGVNNDNHMQKDEFGNSAYPKYSVRNEEQLEKQFAWCEEVGVKGVKVDYFEKDDQKTMLLMKNCAKIAAKHKLNVLFHGCTSPKGEHRTFPNVLSYEAVQGSEWYKWNVGPSVTNSLIYALSRNITGGMDFTPVGTKVAQISTTAGFALAEIAMYQSGFVNIASSVYKLEGYSALPIINDIPVVWDETWVLDAYPGTHNIIARRNGENYYIAAMTSTSKSYNCDLSFLGDGEYTADIYTSNESGNNVVCETKTVINKDELVLNLGTNDGAVVRISKSPMSLDNIYAEYNFYEAEDSQNVLSGNALISDNQFASDMKQVAGIGGNKDNTLCFKGIEAKQAGVYELRLYYASKMPKHILYSINGEEPVRSRGLSAGVNTLAMEVFYVELKEGKNEILFSNPRAAAPNIDRIAISKDTVGKEKTPTNLEDMEVVDEAASLNYTMYDVSKAELSGGAKIENGGIGWLGGSEASTAVFTVNVAETGKYKLKISYFTGEDRSIILKCNDKEYTVSCNSTGSWGADSVADIYVEVELNAGDNNVVLGNAIGWCPNVAALGVSEK